MNRGPFQEFHSADDGQEVKVDDAGITESHVDEQQCQIPCAEDDDASRHEPKYDMIDMFAVPPPPMVVAPDDTENGRKEIIYTIVPGQIAAAAERRGIIPYHVYGIFWPDLGEEFPIERSYYFKPYDEDYSDSDFSEDEDDSGHSIKQAKQRREWVSVTGSFLCCFLFILMYINLHSSLPLQLVTIS